MSEYLPLDVVALILRRLPVETVVKCTAVCKAWYALIKHPSFISNHLQAASLRDDLLLQRALHHYYLRRDSDDLEELKKFRLPLDCGEWGTFTYVGTCNGLICLVVCRPSWDIVLWNPSIHKHFILPRFACQQVRDHFPSCLGFGFDALSEDYKVILIACEAHDLEIWLFSLNNCSWFRLTEFSPKHRWCGVRELRQAVFVNGALHWSGVLNYGVIRHVIMAFDLSTEKFYVMNYPTALVDFDHDISLIKYEDSIAVVTPRILYYNQVECWVMKEYNIDSSWVNVLRPMEEDGNSGFGKHLMDVFGVRKNGEVLVNSSGGLFSGSEIALLDLNCHRKEQQLKHLGIWTHHTLSSVVSFVESLVLFDKGEQDHEGQLE